MTYKEASSFFIENSWPKRWKSLKLQQCSIGSERQGRPSLGIYKRKKESKKTRWHTLIQEKKNMFKKKRKNYLFSWSFSWMLSWWRECFLEGVLFSWTSACFLIFLFSFINSHLLAGVAEVRGGGRRQLLGAFWIRHRWFQREGSRADPSWATVWIQNQLIKQNTKDFLFKHQSIVKKLPIETLF